jgi:hypothetical protein
VPNKIGAPIPSACLASARGTRLWRRRFLALAVAVALLALHATAEAQATVPIDPYAPSTAPTEEPEPAREPAQEVARLPAAPSPPPPPVPAPARERSGLLGGLALGFGSLGAGGDANGTLNYTVSFGGYLSSRLALLVDLWGGRHTEDEFRISNINKGAGVLYWLTDDFWCKGRLGLADYETSVDGGVLSQFRGAAFGVGLGWAFYSRGPFHVDARVSITVETYENTRNNVTASALQIGLQYF